MSAAPTPSVPATHLTPDMLRDHLDDAIDSTWGDGVVLHVSLEEAAMVLIEDGVELLRLAAAARHARQVDALHAGVSS